MRSSHLKVYLKYIRTELLFAVKLTPSERHDIMNLPHCKSVRGVVVCLYPKRKKKAN